METVKGPVKWRHVQLWLKAVSVKTQLIEIFN